MKVKKGESWKWKSESRDEKRKVEMEKVRVEGWSHRIRKANGADFVRKHDWCLKNLSL